MTLRPIIPGILVVVIAVAMVLLLAWGWLRLQRDGADSTARRSWWRRAGIAVVAVAIAAGPSVRSSESISVSNVEVYLLVDRTGSMAAEDWAGPAPEGVENPTATRLDGARADLASIRAAFPTARYSILALDSTAATELPLSTDINAVDAWIGTLTQEVTARSTGSSLELALPSLSRMLAESRQSDPQNIRLVYILSDGEATDEGQGAQEASAQGWSWESLGEVIDGGAVLGYGTAEGGQMRSYDGSPATGEHTSAEPILDSATGQPGVSVIDEEALKAVSQATGLDYVHRTGGQDDADPKTFTDLDIDAVLTDGRVSSGARRFVVWPLGLIGAILMIWELMELIRVDSRLRLLISSGRKP
ncbi:vWA domain-containing protein [Actinomyces slackii]|uniref:VWFA domain-containing protein n=1 Tax=Actinomyces slackii TaxID=52774 RepID=A0A3S4U1K4_9ACTO|nr:vWA domain-containing protein [Actinomyces slackii]VEG74213.1 Uncharacterised protein [Actinomyces slackii]